MDRRDFLKAAAYAGVGLTMPFAARTARADPYTGNYWVLVNASGGWDPTSLCDPKGAMNAAELEPGQNPMNRYLRDDIRTAGNIRYAPVAGNQAFFDKHYQRLMVINGIDTQTNGHDQGSRHIWSGQLQEGYPSLGAVMAASKASDKPLAFISNGGYDLTMNLVAPTRSGDTGSLTRIAFPNRPDPADESRTYHTESTMQRIRDAQRARLGAQRAKYQLPKVDRQMGLLQLARAGENEIKRLTEFLPELDDSNNQLRRQAQLAIAAYKAGISVSANLNTGGFDTHGDHDNRQFASLQRLTEGLDFLLDEAERQGVADKVIVVVGSDFGRTPRYNDQNGKDHWSITSMMMMGPGIPGNRVVGSTEHEHTPIPVNPQTLQPDAANGTRIHPLHIHRQLRKLAGIDEHEIAASFPLAGADLQLFA